MNVNLGKLWEMVRGREAWRAAVHGVTRARRDWATEQQQGGMKMKVLVAQSYLTLCNHMDSSPPGSSVHGISQAKNTGVGSHSLL